MSSITVVDVNEEAKQEVEPIQNEEATEQIEHEVSGSIHGVMLPSGSIREPSSSIGEPTNEVDEEVEKTKQEAKPKPKPKPKPSDRVDCKTCGKNLSYKNYKYRHEKICTAEPKPVKPQANPKPKAQPKAQPKIENTIEKQEVVKAPTPQPTQPQLTPYEKARQSYIQMKEELKARKIEKINNFKSKMF